MRLRTRQQAVLLVLLVVGGGLTACVGQKQYRHLNIPPGSGLQAIEDHSKEGYKIAFIEFKDNGDPHDPQQATAAEELILAERKGPDDQWADSSVVLIYVHGWKNNADQAVAPKKKDVEKFEETLEQVAPLLERLPGDKPTPLIGVYIAWRGKSLELPTALNWVSFWPRGIAAKHVGGRPLTKTLNRLVAASIKGRGDHPIHPKVIIVGHSFGSRVLEEAEKRQSIQKGECNQLHTLGRPIKPPVDLVLYVNAATGSSVTRNIIDECKPKDGSDPNHIFARHPEYEKELCKDDEGPEAKLPICRPYPMFVSISSRSDYATKLLLPFAALRLSAAHTSMLNTHRVIELNKDEEIPGNNVFSFRTKTQSGDHSYAVVPKQKGPIGPFWIMTVDKNVIANHGDIWNPGFRDMLLRLMVQMQVVRMNAPTYQRLPPKSKASEIKAPPEPRKNTE